MKWPVCNDKPLVFLTLVLGAIAVSAASSALAASPEWETPPVSHKAVLPYFDAARRHAQVLPPPLETDSAMDRDDVAVVQDRQGLSPERRRAAACVGPLLRQPGRQALQARAGEYADSRVICGMHFPSDLEAGRQLATAVVTQLDALPEFQADLARARAELAALPP